MKRQLAALALGALLLTGTTRGASISLNGAAVDLGSTAVYDCTTYVPLRTAVGSLLPGAQVSWNGGRAVVKGGGFTLTACPGERILTYNGVQIPLSTPIRMENWSTLVPIRPLAALLGAEVSWNAATGGISLSTSGGDALYWLSRIISAESRGEPLEGKIAVGNVVLNRVNSPLFPNSIYDVIFDGRWGGQFEPVRNGTIYDIPTADSVLAARLCLAGVSTAGESLYFLAPALTNNHWTMETRTYVTTIGAHWFYL